MSKTKTTKHSGFCPTTRNYLTKLVVYYYFISKTCQIFIYLFFQIWRLSERELLTSFCGDLHPSRGAAAVAAAALFRGNQSAAIIAATNPGISDIRLLPTVTGAALIHVNDSNNSNDSNSTKNNDCSTNLNNQMPITHSSHDQKCSMTAASTACRFLSCGADGGLRMRSLVVRPKPSIVC